MKDITIEAAAAGKRLDRYLLKALPALPMGLMRKFIRLKRIKLNGHPAAQDARLAAGDILTLFIDDEFFAIPDRPDPFLSKFHPHLEVLYEDENLLIVDKQPGLVCHPDADEKINTLLNHVRAYLYQRGQWRPGGRFSPALCNRIDRFTGGIVIAAKNEAALKAMDQKIRNHEVNKQYLAIVHGRMREACGEIRNYLYKPDGAKRVQVLETELPGAQPAVTRFETLAADDELSLLRITLITGRTHQIRAQFAHLQHPLLGDSQYGDRRLDQRFGRNYQALCACRVTFDFRSADGILDELAGKSVAVKEVPFVRIYFPNIPIEP